MRRTRSTSIRAAGLTFPVLLLAAACGAPAPADPSPESLDRIEAMLHASAEDWTRGDLDGFLDDYAPDATFVGASGLTRGVDQIRQAYVDGYWSTGRPRDGLRFGLLDVRQVGPAAAVAVGRYFLYDRASGETTSSGVFSLTLAWTADGWKIVHDHSSGDDAS